MKILKKGKYGLKWDLSLNRNDRKRGQSEWQRKLFTIKQNISYVGGFPSLISLYKYKLVVPENTYFEKWLIEV